VEIKGWKKIFFEKKYLKRFLWFNGGGGGGGGGGGVPKQCNKYRINRKQHLHLHNN
jgi:hypothetical protein